MSLKFSGTTITGIEDVNRALTEVGPREGRNLIRATVQDIAVQLAKSGKEFAPDDTGGLKAGIKAKRDKPTRNTVTSTVRVFGAFYWRFLEYGDGPDGVEHAYFLKALQEIRPNMDRVYMEAFAKKLAARIKREMKRG
ncbi:MAG: HK97 gp10 family phage protein [Pseudomonadota bacterium]